MAQQQTEYVVGEPRQEGSRWINRRPEPEELAAWFEKNVRIDDQLEHGHYLPGIVLIPNKEWVDQVVNGEIKRIKQLVYTPYPKVETREMYFWDYCAAYDYIGEIEQRPAPDRKDLPGGFFSMPVSDGANRVTPFVGTTYQVRIWTKDAHGGKKSPVRIPPPGTKVVSLLKRNQQGVTWPDENAIAKAQTGAIGRALGYAGMLIVPGAGIATAEDMQEFVSGETGAEPQLPPISEQAADAKTETTIADAVAEIRSRLESEFPDAYEEAAAWCQEKGYSITDPPETALRGLERQLRRKLQQALARPAPEADAPA